MAVGCTSMATNTLDLILSSTLRMSTPLILAALGAMFSNRSGIMALGLEGMISFGAFTAVWGSWHFDSPAIGLACGMVGGMLFGVLHGVLTIRYHVNHIISGLGLNLFVFAFIPLMLKVLWNLSSNSPQVPAISNIVIPAFKNVPILGALFYSNSPLTWLAFLLVPLIWTVLYKTVFGMRLRVIGNNPYAASTAGVDVKRYKYCAVVICGALAGLAGSFLSICQLNLYSDGMSAQRGYIAIAINALGGSNPVGILFAGMLFGFTDATQIFLQGSIVPVQLLKTVPYVATLIALVLVGKQKSGAAFLGKHFEEQS